MTDEFAAGQEPRDEFDGCMSNGMPVKVVDHDASFRQLMKSTQDPGDFIVREMVQEQRCMHDIPSVLLKIMYVALPERESIYGTVC